MDEHDAILEAFQAVATERNETIAACDRGGDRGWTNIHGPARPPTPGETRCSTHCLGIQKLNGAVIFGRQLGERLHAEERPNEPISEQHPLGFTHRALSVSQPCGLTAPTILARWGTYEKFARDVVIACQDLGIW
jgi:hypothetical protein